MKVRDSGMPEAAFWESLFNVELVLDRMGVDGSVRDLAEFGCGYGTFTLPGGDGGETGRCLLYDYSQFFSQVTPSGG